MIRLQPHRGFNWMAVSWGGPDEPPPEACCYCDTPISHEDVPLIFWNRQGWCARFRARCQRQWFGAAEGEATG